MFNFLILLIFFANPVFAWWDSSHMAVTQIAKNRLTPRAKFHVEELISIFAEHYPSSADFITASCWADDIKDSLFDFSSWHKQLIPYDPDQILSASQKEEIFSKAKEKGLAYGIQKCTDTLKDQKSNYYEKGIALRLLIHLVADAHMPLHCAVLYNKHFPNGDKGGSLFKLNGILEGEDTLHGLWDSCLLLDYYELKRPLTMNGKRHIAEFAEELELNFPADLLLESIELDTKYWIQESYNLAVNVAYQGIVPYSNPSEEYLNKSKAAACRQLALAGYRLSYLLNKIFENYQ